MCIVMQDHWNLVYGNNAIQILTMIGFEETAHPIHQGIQRYLASEKDFLGYGWPFTIKTNDDFPHAPWWNYSEEQNQREYYGVTAELTAYILKFFEPANPLYQKAQKLADKMVQFQSLYEKLSEKITQAIEHDKDKWEYYGVRPSNYIREPQSRFYEPNKEIVDKELNYLAATLPQNDVWGITWTWYENMDKYGKYFYISENWWKASRAIENLIFLRNFSRL